MVPSFYNEAIAATFAGCASTLLGHPLDTIKVHLQTHSSYRGTLHAATSLNIALFRGMTPPLANAILMNTLMFSAFAHTKTVLNSQLAESSGVSAVTASLVAGMISGIATAFVSTPMDFIKIQAQLRCSSSLIVWQQTQWTILFRGHVPNLCREALFTTVYLGLYDLQQPKGFAQVALTSSLTGALAWIASYPMDTIKTIVQGSSIASRVTMRQAVAKLSERPGGTFRALYRGCAASTGRAMLVTSSRMIVYEWTMAGLSA